MSEPPEDQGDDRLLPDEAKAVSAGSADDLRRWVGTYQELLRFKEHLLEEIADQKRRIGEPGAAELDHDRELVERERDRIGRRLRYWEGELEKRSRS
jgi:hypothetical protein